MNNPISRFTDEQLETAGELLAPERKDDDEATAEVSVEQSSMAIEILRKLGGRSVTGYNPRMVLRKELGIPRNDDDRRKLFGETFDMLCDVRLVRTHEPKPGAPKDSRSAGLTFTGEGAYRNLFDRAAPVTRPRNR